MTNRIDLRIELHNDGQTDIYSDGPWPFAVDQLTQGEALACAASVILRTQRLPYFGNKNVRPLPTRLGGVQTVVFCRSHRPEDWGHEDNWLKVSAGEFEADGLCPDEALFLVAKFILSPRLGSMMARRRQQPRLEGMVQL